MDISKISRSIRSTRLARGYTQAQLAARAGLSRTTVNQLESGVVADLGMRKLAELLSVLGLDLAVVAASESLEPDFLGMAAQSASVSYRGRLTPQHLVRVMRTGRAPAGLIPHLRVVFDEVSPKVLDGAIEQAGLDLDRPTILANLREAARQVGTQLRLDA